MAAPDAFAAPLAPWSPGALVEWVIGTTPESAPEPEPQPPESEATLPGMVPP